jgi:acetyltransferase EpsM
MIYIIGSGGRAKLIKEVLIRNNIKKVKILFIDDSSKNFKSTQFLFKNFKRGKDKLFIGISDPKLQKIKYNFFKKKFIKIDNSPLIDSRAIIKSNVKLGKNSIILENSIIGPNVEIFKNAFIGSNSIICHDSKIGAFTTIGHGTILDGNVKVGNGCFIGNGSIIKYKVKIVDNKKFENGSNILK